MPRTITLNLTNHEAKVVKFALLLDHETVAKMMETEESADEWIKTMKDLKAIIVKIDALKAK